MRASVSNIYSHEHNFAFTPLCRLCFASGMALSPLAGKPAPAILLIDVTRLERDYYQRNPDLADVNQLVSFGTSGHRGTPFKGTFTEAAHSRDDAGDLRIPQKQRHQRAAVHGQGSPRDFRRRPTHRARSARGQRRGDIHPARRRLYAYSVHLPRDPDLQSRSHRRRSPMASSSRHRTIRRRMVGSNTIRPMAVRRTRTSPAGCRIARMNSCGAATRSVHRQTYESALKASNTHPHDFITPMWKLSAKSLTWRPSAPQAFASALIRSAALPCNTGSR